MEERNERNNPPVVILVTDHLTCRWIDAPGIPLTRVIYRSLSCRWNVYILSLKCLVNPLCVLESGGGGERRVLRKIFLIYVSFNNKTRGPLVLYRSSECWEYAELEQTWKYINIQCCISFHPWRSIRKQIWPCHKNGQGQASVIIRKHW